MNKKKIILKRFIAFLRRKNIYDKYITYLLQTSDTQLISWKLSGLTPYYFLVKNIEIWDGILLFTFAFDWEHTQEGYSFWWNISDEWRKHLSTFIT